ncbi:hypothetical protein T4B_9549 [Trichinella pseudospiralis]|uniref:Uncharacterized protein n=1 Tax=Trichinella pseudospiralis TaxID=6337 RepID=A0A0V1IZL3_TRIPS|nr:hypothetical protein T4B_9549 [Trichinella pseudospiralis]
MGVGEEESDDLFSTVFIKRDQCAKRLSTLLSLSHSFTIIIYSIFNNHIPTPGDCPRLLVSSQGHLCDALLTDDTLDKTGFTFSKVEQCSLINSTGTGIGNNSNNIRVTSSSSSSNSTAACSFGLIYLDLHIYVSVYTFLHLLVVRLECKLNRT